ncbi:MAG: trypsin-like peptidase domain-containing protein [Clostridia bacterium]|nr:trypsin-like peptidase domain-containing protein [Clostridia bacterium]
MKKSNLYGLIALVLTFVMIFSVMVSASAAGSLTTQEIDQILNTTTDTAQTSNAVTEAVAKVYDSVVLVRNYTVTRSSNYGYGWGWGWGYDNDYGNNQGAERLAGFGSGTVVTDYGHVLTNYHVIEGASRVTVYDGENEYAAEVVAYDEDKDVAVLLAPELKLPAVELGDSDALQVGETAIVIGNPMSENFFRTTTVGVISSMDREIKSQSVDKYGRRGTTTNSMIQTDAAINSGNSGGGLFNVLGQLMGIPSMVYRGSNSFFSNSASVESIGMCVPINVAKTYIREALEKYDAEAVQQELAEKAKENDRNTTGNDMTDKPRLGITMSTLSASNSAVANGVLPRGCIVREVEKNSPAEAAGIQAGDIIVEVDGTVITDASSLQKIILEHEADDTVSVKVYRAETNPLEAEYLSDIGDGEYIDIDVTLQVVGAPAA